MISPELSNIKPRTYWLQPVSRGSAIVYSLVGLGYILDMFWPLLTRGKLPGFAHLFFFVIYLAIFISFAIFSLRSYVRVSWDSIEFSRFKGKKILPFNKIQGRRRYTEKADPYGPPAKHLVLEPNDPQFPQLDLEDGPWLDESFYQWFDALPDLDAVDSVQQPRSKYANFSLV